MIFFRYKMYLRRYISKFYKDIPNLKASLKRPIRYLLAIKLSDELDNIWNFGNFSKKTKIFFFQFLPFLTDLEENRLSFLFF